MTDHARMRFFGTLHPAVSMCYFVCVIGLTLACPHVVTVLLSLLGSTLFNLALRGRKAFGRTMRFVLPMFLLVCIGNPLVNHRGVTMLCLLFNQWITLEAIVYGVVTACSLAAIILWFGCYQEVMTSDKFLYLFGKIAPATALLITSALRFIPQMQQNAAQIKESRAMLQDNSPRLFQKLAHAVQNLSALLGMSMENAVQTADSMKARGFGARRRTTFHLFRFDARDARTLALILMLSGIRRRKNRNRPIKSPLRRPFRTRICTVCLRICSKRAGWMPTWFRISPAGNCSTKTWRITTPCSSARTKETAHATRICAARTASARPFA